ncbi:MAG: hypothetical protein J0I06_15665 [Planctomycetes bacterium]|nr:hypothetical protein [Planctomycetota bacterium]
MPRADRISYWTNQLNSFAAPGTFITWAEMDARVEQSEDVDSVLDARIQKVLLTIVKERLDSRPEENQRFKPTTDWKILNQLLTIARLKELSRVKIVKKGRSSGGAGFYIEELSKTHYGRQILGGLGFSKQKKVLDKDELEKVKAEFAKIKLALPEAVEPTTTEKYFAQDTAP